MMWLKQSTASQEILLGVFLDSTDGDTEETALTINNTDIKVWKEGATTEANKTLGGATHIANGRYYAVLDATDTDTLGKLEINVHVSGALAVRREFMVVPANVYDSLILGTDTLNADMTQLGGVTQSATDLKDFADAGYDPATNKVQGVVLVDTCTTNTDMLTNSDITKNATFSNFEFPMVLTSDHYTAATSKTVTGEMSIDGAAFASINGTIAEIGSGVYQIDLTANDTNGDVITYKFSAASCDDTIITVTTKA